MNKHFSLLCLVLLMLVSACSTATPSPTPTPEPTATATHTPTATMTLTSTPTATPTDTPTYTPTPTEAPTSTPEPTAAPTATPIPAATADPIPDRQTYASPGLGFSIAYPGAWQPAEGGNSMTIKSPELSSSNRTQGAELIVAVGAPKRPDEPLQAEWESAIGAFPEVSYGEASVITIGGEEAYRAIFSDPRDGSYGWFIVLRHSETTYIIAAQSFGDTWANYEPVFRAMLYTLWFSG